MISAKDNTESPLRVCGPGSNLADHRLLELTASGELILACATGHAALLAELGAGDLSYTAEGRRRKIKIWRLGGSLRRPHASARQLRPSARLDRLGGHFSPF